MKKEVVKEFDRTILAIDIMLYCIFITVGFVLLHFSEIELINPIKYASPLFYMFGFFSLLAYFLNRRKGDYELLIFGFINVCVGSFVLIYMSFPDTGFILADAVLIYSIANVINKAFNCKRLLLEKDINFFTKASIAILLLFLGVFVVSSLYTKVEVGSLILGYYFVVFGLLSLLEPLMAILVKNIKIENKILEFLTYEEEEEVKVVPKVREVKSSKIVKKKATRTTTKRKSTSKTTTKKKTVKSKK
ncbi:MAG: hypothetical protein IKR57_04010 [Bacilli bacterium]|nr:hypothetical protein [Bacilli bacterium]